MNIYEFRKLPAYDKQNEIECLVEAILYHKNKYYKGMLVISDEGFDHLEDALREIDPTNPVLELVGTPEEV